MTDFYLPDGKKAYFISDLHLGARYFKDQREAEKRVVRFLDYIKKDAAILFMVGDVLDYWYEYRYVVPRGFVRFLGKLAELSDAGIKIVWLIGNHDIWIFDYIPDELGVTVVDGAVDCKINDTRFYITHGDDVDDTSLSFNLLRKLFRNKICQKMYAAIHPRWTIPFAFGWSRKSRQDEHHHVADASPKRFEEFAKLKLLEFPDIKHFIFGHLHILYRSEIAPGCDMTVAGEWIKTYSYLVFDGKTLLINIFEQK